MGAHQSHQSVSTSASIAANIAQKTTQDCVNVAVGGNTVDVEGSGNVVAGVTQRVSVTVDSDCSTLTGQNSTFAATLNAAAAQTLKDQEVALTQWLDNSRDDQSSNIRQSVETNFTQSSMQNCVSSLQGLNQLVVEGDQNVVKNVTQEATLDALSRCIMSGAQTSEVVNDITNTVNQHSAYEAKNPLAFITDAISALFKSAIVAAAVIFVMVVCCVILFVILRASRRKSPGSGPGLSVDVGPGGLESLGVQI